MLVVRIDQQRARIVRGESPGLHGSVIGKSLTGITK
jgi:hypothetical protein